MNLVKFVPSDPKVRALSEPTVLLVNTTQTKECFFRRPIFKKLRQVRPLTVREAEIMAGRRGWTRLAYLPKTERARYRGAKEVRG